MQINSIDKNNFEGKFIIKGKTKANKGWFIRDGFSYPIDGVSNKQILDKKTFDVEVYQVSKHNLDLVSRYKTHNYDLHIHEEVVSNRVSLRQGLTGLVNDVRKHITDVETQKKKDNGFNTFGERVKTYFKMALGF